MITLATLGDATAQEVFDQAKSHLLTQNKRSTNKAGFCTYRGANGTKCAAGCFIADDEYREEFESKSWRMLADEDMITGSTHNELIIALQQVHDVHKPDKWPQKLKEVAAGYGLNY